MTFKSSKLAQLVVAYQAYFGTHVPLGAMKVLQPVDLVALIQKTLATNTPLAETGWGRASPIEFGPFRRGGCCIMEKNPERATPAKLPTGEWLH